MDEVIYYVNRSNQRSARMLSVIDLIEAKTLTLQSAAWLLRRITEGSSWLVGAKPGAAGKTTVASALLAMLPADTKIHLLGGYTAGYAGSYASPLESTGSISHCGKNICILTYEISPASYDGYIWKDEVKLMTQLGIKGCRLVGNLHADTLEQAREQICKIGGATEEEFGTFDIFIPITLKPRGFSYERRIEHVYLFNREKKGWERIRDFSTPESTFQREIENFLQSLAKSKIILVEEVRKEWLKWLNQRGGSYTG